MSQKTAIESLSEATPICFVVMPISDPSSYEEGHFGRVFDYLIKPACEMAGFRALRADDTTKTNYIVIDVLRAVLESPMVLCDLSSRNPNVLYELGVRQAFNRPVVLIKDDLTDKIFDIQGLRYYEYDHSLRVDSVRRDTEKITAFLRDTAHSGDTDVNSIIKLLGVRPAEIHSPLELSRESSLLLGAIQELSHRLSNLETVIGSPFRKTVNLPSGKVTIGEQLYVEGREVGTFVGLQNDGVIVRGKDGHLLKIPVDSADFEKLSTIPF